MEENENQLNVSIVGDSPLGVLGLTSMLNSMGIHVLAVKARLEDLFQCETEKYDAILIDIYLVREARIWKVVEHVNKLYGGCFVIFGEGSDRLRRNMAFIHRAEHPRCMKRKLRQAISAHKKGRHSTPHVPPYYKKISALETFVLNEWINGRTVTEIARQSNRSVKTISSHKRNAMKKLMVKNDRELYWKLKGERM
ncbi:LuxR C-terminal-related transcriptional regulator [Serratia marcescens]|uniref:LuxR C-terminal-related transcriptional regulator n=1 Tax=Serratia marcescens TaxID=615 RepID=UPI0006ECF7B0|nr:LuxR C-terminal-related transcriptional regulator [Serratia marcescens]ALL39871.1 DNA-binding response regulator [Serratia marcescens]PHI54212.1 DNA-binding response regulator [Serratia marcescens]UJA53676.1 LuxR C-terminal-related transcriptional regulator [Serratia marcescens]